MPPQQSTSNLLSPSELAYLYTSLSCQPPVRLDARLPTQFRPLVAETNFLPATNGSARLCFADGTEAIVGVKAEVEKTPNAKRVKGDSQEKQGEEVGGERRQDSSLHPAGRRGDDGWLELNIDIPGIRDDDELPATLSSILTEALLATGSVGTKLWINRFWHWRLYVDIILLSAPSSLPLPLLSLATHLALLSTRLPALKSTGDEDPLFDDDWEASPYLYPRNASPSQKFKESTLRESTPFSTTLGPPVTLLVASIAPSTLLFDPSAEEIAVADTLLAVSFAAASSSTPGSDPAIRILNVRTIDPPARLSTPGVPDQLNPATGATEGPVVGVSAVEQAKKEEPWRPPRGGLKRGLVKKVMEMVLKEEKGGVGKEVLDGLRGVDVG